MFVYLLDAYYIPKSNALVQKPIRLSLLVSHVSDPLGPRSCDQCYNVIRLPFLLLN